MRFQDWDVLLFPSDQDAHIPFKEFRVACQVVHDNELSHTHGSLGLPTMTCFVPSLPAGSRFYLSIHCWNEFRARHVPASLAESTRFEARVLIDGYLVAVSYFGRHGTWPHEIDHGLEFTKSGEHESLKFPHFRQELLYQDHWNAADDIGRIKVVLSEGCPRDSHSASTARVRNMVTFSFQHAPLGILENNGIAWPNPSMWRRPLPNPVPAHVTDTGHELRTHSLRRRPSYVRPSMMRGFPTSLPTIDVRPPQVDGFLASQTTAHDMDLASHGATARGNSLAAPFSEASYTDWVNSLTSFGATDGRTYWPANTLGRSKRTSTDMTMSDLTSPDADQDPCGEPMHISGDSLEDDPIPSNADLTVPTNTPTSGNPAIRTTGGANAFSFGTGTSSIPENLATSPTQSILNQPLPPTVAPQNIPLPASVVKSRRERRLLAMASSNPSSATSTPQAEVSETRKFGQPISIADIASNAVARSGSASHGNSGANSPCSPPSFFSRDSRNSSAIEFGVSMADLTTGSPVMPLGESSASTINIDLGSAKSADGGSKRNRDFTPTLAKSFDEECESSQASPVDEIGGRVADITTVG